jgi:CRP-like cAMP-binding protein
MSDVKISSNVIWTLPFFSKLNDVEKAELLKVANFRHVKRGETLFLQGDRLTHFYWVCSGAIQKFRVTPDGRELTGAIRTEGDVLYDPDARQREQHHAMNARAVQETSLLAIPASWIDEHIKLWPHLADHFMTLLAGRAQEALIDTEHQATMNAAQLVSCFLQKLCVLHHFDPHGFELPYSKSLIASRLGMELETFSRTLPKLRELGITVTGKHVAFDNISLAQSHACNACTVTEECLTHAAMQEMATRSVGNYKKSGQ